MQENKEALEYLMSVVDEAERAVTGDPLGEVTPPSSYSLGFPDQVLDERSCRECRLWTGKAGREEYINFGSPQVLCIIPHAEPGLGIMKNDALTMYENQMVNVLGLQRSQRALVALIKCPTETFERELADVCKPLIKKDMEKFSPKAMILFGTDTARYMLRQNGPFETLRAGVRGKPWAINHIPAFVTYSQRECIMNPALKKAVFEDLLAIKAALR